MATPSRSAEDQSPQVPLLAALLLAAIAFRPQLAVIGPLAVSIREGLGANHAFVGLLTAIPVLCMGLFAPLAPYIAGRVGAGRGIALVAIVIAAAGMARGIIPLEAPILAMTVSIGIATAFSGPLQATFVRARLPGHVVAGTAAYAAGTTAGAALAAALAIPLAAMLGGWREALVAVSVLSIAGLPVLLWVLRDKTRHAVPPAVAAAPVHRPSLRDLPIRRPAVWGLGLLFGLQSCLYYGTLAWLPSVYIERGWAQGPAGMLISLSNVTGFAAILVVPLAARRGVGRRDLLSAAALVMVAALLGVVAFPDPGYLWAALLGVGTGMIFTLVQTLPSDAARNADETGGAAALMLLVGYLIAAGAPFMLGAVRDATGSFTEGLWALVAIGVAMIPLTVILAPERLRPHALARGREAIS
jgi:CP family cyanate transporter-like MFS transporter